MSEERDRRPPSGSSRGLPSWLSWLSGRSVEREEIRVTCWHLTPRGWVRDGGRGDEAAGIDGAPDDRVITCAYVDAGSAQEIHAVWIGDAEHARKLMWRFGRCPWSHGDSPHPGVVSG